MMRIIIRGFLLLILISVGTVTARSQQQTTIVRASEMVNINSGIEFLEDAGHKISPDSAFKSNGFQKLADGIPNKKFTSSVYWFRFKIKNETNSRNLILKVANPALDSVGYYEQISQDAYRDFKTGQSIPFAHREYLSSDYLFSVSLPPGNEKYIYLRIYANAELLLPLSIGTEPVVFATDKYKDIFWGIYIGIMLAMILYNCFVYSTTKDDSYLYYIVYMIPVVITQITVSGYAFQMLWPENLWLAQNSRVINTTLAGVTAILFIRHFLKTKTFVPIADKILVAFAGIYFIGAGIGLTVNFRAGVNIIDMMASALSLFALGIAVVMCRKRYRPAYFFFVAWLVFLSGVFIFVFKNFGILPYNNFTVYTMPVGSAMEVLLLSFALADRINILKKNAAESHAAELLALQENERIVQEQNIVLESRVNERTYELVLSNESLNKALVDLKDAQLQLVESEKMASLGQVTAGIAHEINNPLNFASANVKPLSRDVRMLMDTIAELERIMNLETTEEEKRKLVAAYKNEIDLDYLKQEIGELITGIENGVLRTAQVVNVLRVFSRLDEGDLKVTDMNEGLDAALAFLNNRLDNIIEVDKSYASVLMVECYSGKVNQVFSNVLSNAIYAIKKKFGEAEGGRIKITTSADDRNAFITIADNGVGIDKRIMQKIFEPFFTTRGGEGGGVGLGLSIAFNTMKQHKGKIDVKSELGKGSEFVITLPLMRK